MNRPIKFRAWDEIRCKMLLDFSWINSPSDMSMHGPTITYKHISGGGHRPISEFSIMQSTGLKDKNGKEIWEGDVCKIYWHDVNEIFNAKVIFEDGSWLYDMTKSPFSWDSMPIYPYNKECEVIGNIYEHPELIKGEG